MGHHLSTSATVPSYIDDSEYDRLVADLLAAPGDMCPTSAIKIALGEIVNVWPQRIRADAEAAQLEAARADLPAGFTLGIAGDVLRVKGHGHAKSAVIDGRPVDQLAATLVREIEAEVRARKMGLVNRTNN